MRSLCTVVACASIAILCAAPVQWTSVGPEGGIVTSLAADPRNPSAIYASMSGGGLFKTSDGGGSWSPLTGLPPVLCCVLAVDPQNAGRAYAAAGDGIYKTIDGGATWNLVSLRAVGFTVQTLRVTSEGAVYASAGGGPIAKSTDGGATWTRVSSQFTLLAVDPQNPDILYANGPPKGVLKSVDGGANWSVVTSVYFSFLVVDPQKSGTLYGGAGWQILKSTDGGASWVSLSFGYSPTNPPVVPDGILSLAIHPRNPDLLYGIVNRFVDVPGLLSSTYYLIESTDGGSTWTTATAPMLAVGDLKTILPDPIDPATLYLGTTSGVLKTSDGGASWNFQNSGLQASAIREVVVDPQTTGTLFAVPDSMGQAWRGIGLMKSTDAGNSWFPSGVGLPWGLVSLVADPLNPRTLYAACPHNNGGSYSQGFGVFKSGDGGASWNEIWAIPTPGTTIYPLAISPQAPDVLYAGVTACPYLCTSNVARSGDAGRTWTQPQNPLSTDEYLSAIATDPRDPNVVYAGTSDLGGWGTGGSFKSVDGGVSWMRTGNGAVYILVIDPRNPDRPNSFIAGPCDTFLGAFAYDPQGSGALYCGADAKVFRSADSGKNWTEVGSGLRGRVNSLAFGSRDSRTLYAATSGGLFAIPVGRQDQGTAPAKRKR